MIFSGSAFPMLTVTRVSLSALGWGSKAIILPRTSCSGINEKGVMALTSRPGWVSVLATSWGLRSKLAIALSQLCEIFIDERFLLMNFSSCYEVEVPAYEW